LLSLLLLLVLAIVVPTLTPKPLAVWGICVSVFQ